MNTPAKRAAAMRDWLAMGAAIAAYWDAKREWEGLV